MLDFPCYYPQCTTRTGDTTPHGGSCNLCFRHLCWPHWSDVSHTCFEDDVEDAGPKEWEAQLAHLQTVLDGLEIAQHAIKLRPGHTVKPLDLSVKSLPAGRFHVHVPVEFDDGVRWVARVRRTGYYALPSLVERHYIQGEIDVMKWLVHCEVSFVPKVMSEIYTHGGTDFYFMEMLSGTACGNPIWGDDKPRAQVSNTILDIAKTNILRAQHPLPLVGGIHYDRATGGFSVGPMYTESIEYRSPAQFPGPWRTAAGKYEWQFNYILDEIRAGTRYKHKREKAFLCHRWMKEVLIAYPPYNVEGENYVVHEDSNGGHILTDEEGRITGLIDWERASVGPKCEAFASCQGFEEELYHAGSNELSWAELELIAAYNQLGRPDLAACITQGKPFQWLATLIGYAEWYEYKYLKALGESLGLEMKESMEEFLDDQRVRFGGELEPLE